MRQPGEARYLQGVEIHDPPILTILDSQSRTVGTVIDLHRHCGELAAQVQAGRIITARTGSVLSSHSAIVCAGQLSTPVTFSRRPSLTR